MLTQYKIETGLNKIDEAIELLRDNEPIEGYYLADSGGKDSCVARDILIRSGCKFDAHYSVSPIDPPQIRAFLKRYHPDTQWDYYAKGFWNTVLTRQLPLRTQRWCCPIIKEAGGYGRTVVSGVRSQESKTRSDYPYINTIITKDNEPKIMVYPILDFTATDVWEYIKLFDVDYCELYDQGFKRIGCVLCPNSSNIKQQERMFPEIVRLWKRACEKLIEKGYYSKYEHTPESLYNWWTTR